MPAMLPPTGPIEVSDPNNVSEIFVAGPFNIMNAGVVVHFTFTATRPNSNDLLKGSTTPEFRGVVACRLVMPLEMAQQLSRTLAGSVSKAAGQAITVQEIVIRPN
jgi:hypothetical protein